MLKPLAGLPLLLLLIVMGCQKQPPAPQPPSGSTSPPADEGPGREAELLSQADQAYAAGEYGVAVETYEKLLDRNLGQHEDRLLFRLGLLYLLGGETFRPERAEIVLAMLVAEHPSSEYALSAPLLLQLQKRLVALKEQAQEQDQTISALMRQLEQLKEIDLKRKPPGT